MRSVRCVRSVAAGCARVAARVTVVPPEGSVASRLITVGSAAAADWVAACRIASRNPRAVW